MARVAGFGRRILGHEGNRFAVLIRNFLHPLLKEHVHVRHGERLIVVEVDLVLAAAPFAFAALDRHSGSGHAVADDAHERLVARRLHHVIIDSVVTGWLQVTITGGESRVIGLIEQIEFQFAGAEAGEPLLVEELELLPQDGPWGFPYE